MIFKNTWLWIIVALVLLAASAWHFERSRHTRPAQAGPLSLIRTESVTNVQVQLDKSVIRVEKTNGIWILSEPAEYPADARRVEQLARALEHLRPAIYISARELIDRPNAQEEYGFGTPQASIFVTQPGYRAHVVVGARTAPGGQVFLQIVGDEGIYVVDASLLSLIPKKSDDWRSTAVLDPNDLAFDRIMITNSGKGFELRKAGSNQWQILTSDFSPRADSSKVEGLIDRIRALRVDRFVPDERRADLDSYGLQSPDFQFCVAQGTNSLCTLQFGKALTNDSALVYARNTARNAVLIVNCTNTLPWPTMSSFRDTHLLGGLPAVNAIEVRYRTNQFKVARGTNETWTISPETFAVDQRLVKDLLRILSDLPITDFVKDVAPAQALGEYGLSQPDLEYVLRLANSVTNSGVSTNIIYLQFSTNREDKVLVRRSDEPSIYAIKLRQRQCLPQASFELRERQIWKFPIEELSGVTLEQAGTNCHLLRQGDHQWKVAPGSKGVIEPVPVEETLLDLVDLKATLWLPSDSGKLSGYGFGAGNQRVTLEFKNGDRRVIEVAPPSAGIGIASVKLDGQPWVFAMSPSLRRDIALYLCVPHQNTL